MASKPSTKPLITLYVPGNRRDLIGKVTRFAPDAVILDLEDAVPAQLKAEVRQELASLIPAGIGLPALVRVNSDPAMLADDIRAVVCAGLYGVVLPMAETAAQVQNADALISAAERDKGLEPGSVKLLLLVETALGVRNCYECCTAAARVESVVFGSAEDGDLQADLRCAFSIDGPELMYARSKTLLDARAARLPYVLDGAFSDVKNEAALRADCTVSKRLGYNGRTLIYPGHIGPAREVYSADPAEVAHYKRLVSEFEKALAEGKAAISLDGKLVDYAMFKKAKIFLDAAE